MSRNAVAAMAVVLVSGFAGCAATSRAAEPPALALAQHRSHAAPAPERLSPATPRVHAIRIDRAWISAEGGR